MSTKRPPVSLTLKESSSSDQENSGSSDTGTKRHKTMRRQNACGPCRVSKTKCDGAEPCGACRSERRKSKTCEYSATSGRCSSQNQQAELRASTSGSSNSAIPHTVLKTEQCERIMLQNSIQSQGFDQPPRPSELNMHKVLLLRRVVDEFIDVGPPKKGRASIQIKHIQRLWSSFIKSGMSNAPSAGSTHASTSHLLSEQITPQERLKTWQTHLDATVQLVNAGRLVQAWNSVATLMREIESFDIEHEQTLRRSTAMSESTTLICLKLIDLECALSFFVGGGSHLASWTDGGFLSSKIKQHKMDDHLFAVKTSLYSEIQVILQTDVSQKEGLWKFLQIVDEMNLPSPPTDLIKVSLTTKKDDTAGMQELLLISHLCLAILRCRTAVVSGHYAEQGLPVPSDSPSDIVRQLQLYSTKKKKGTESGEVVMHARAVLQAFESLCKIDPEGTAQSWFRLCGALIAAILVAVAKLRGQTKDEEADKILFGRIEARFEELKTRNPSSPIYDKALEIVQQFGEQTDLAREAAEAKMETKTPIKQRRNDSIPTQRCAEFQISALMDIKAKCPPVAPSSTGIAKMNESDTPVRQKRRKVVKAKTIQLNLMPLEGEVKIDSNHGEPKVTNMHTNSVQVMASRPLSGPEMDASGSYNSNARIISEHSTFDDYSANECELYHLHIDEMSRPPHAIWAHAPHLPNGNDWYWCETDCQQCSFRQMNESVAVMSSIPLIGQGYLDRQFNITQQPYTTIQPTESFGSCSAMTIDNTTPHAISHALNGSTIFPTGSEDVDSGRARVPDMEIAILPSEAPLQGPREYDTRMDVTIKESDGWNKLQVEPLQCNGMFAYDNGPRWYPATLTQQGALTHAYEQQYGQAETPGLGACASLGGLWGYRSDNEWSSAESSFRDEADASNLRQ